VLWTLALLATSLAFGLDDQSYIAAVDRAMSSRPLGTLPAERPGRLIGDGEGQCARLPYSSCKYRDGNYYFYYLEGKLISKTFAFTRLATIGPFGLSRGDSMADAVRKLTPLVGYGDYGNEDDVLFYEIPCAPMKCRLDIQFGKHGIKNIRLYYSDAV
jgi:hypothetical protein